ncbi:MAG: hypothetical protein ACE37L_10140 [Allomuricauda sp.]
MRLQIHIAIWFTLGLATIGTAQNSNLSFYKELAQKDALREQTIAFSNIEDEKDFWNDQIQFENDLRVQNVAAYQVYMNEKRVAYSNHAEECKNGCTHSDLYYQQAGFYFTYSDDTILTKEAVGTVVQVASPRIF